jgi:monoamine oxidase
MYDLVIVGAGAAGLGAARAALDHGLDVLLVEASHRIGGRAYSEQILPGIPFDLGCHWLHSASINPFVEIADRLGVRYESNNRWEPRVRVAGGWATDDESVDFQRYWQDCEKSIEECKSKGRDVSVAEAVERSSRWAPFHDYWTSLMTSSDSDLVSVVDLATYNDTGENWPVTDGYGTLVSRFGADIPVSLNTCVERIDYSGPVMRLHTPRGVIETRKVLVTVSNGILSSGRILFDPPLPDWKLDAIAAIPLGNHNRIALAFDGDPFGADAPTSIIDLDDETPMLLHIKPYGQNYAVGVTGGRFANWLERAGERASIDHLLERLGRIFGGDVVKMMCGHIVTAWGSDPWTLGAYSTCLPGQAHQRAALAAPIENRLWFAGEATSLEFFSTCHGAYMSGVDSANAIADRAEFT